MVLLFRLPLILIALAFFPQTLRADPAVLRGGEDWDFDLTIYGFLPVSVTGTSTIAGQSANLDLGASDVLDMAEFALSGRFEAWRGDFGLILDANYAELAADRSVAIGPGPGLRFDVNSRQQWLGLLAGWRVVSGTLAGSGSGNNYSFDLQGGARYNALRQTFAVSANNTITFGGDEKWWEPVIAGRGTWQLSDRWNTDFMFDAGGFGAGGNKLAWSATLGFRYEAWHSGTIDFGWRYYSIDFATDRADGRFAYDVTQTGPFFGVTFNLR